MEPSQTPSFKNIVGELLRRHRHGIFAVRSKTGSVEVKTTGQWGPQVGLASLIQHRVCSDYSSRSKDGVAAPATAPASIESAALPELELATTDHLIERLRHFPEQWILGLARPARVGDGLVPIVAAKGSTLICAGMAAVIAHFLCEEDREYYRNKHHSLQDPLNEPLGWLSVIHDLIASERMDQTWMLGFTRGLEFSWLARGDEANDDTPATGDAV
jgi:hypothetical protein